jgi:hypothetical protein
MAKRKTTTPVELTLIPMAWIGYCKGICSLCKVGFSTQRFMGSEQAHRSLLRSFFASHIEAKHRAEATGTPGAGRPLPEPARTRT